MLCFIGCQNTEKTEFIMTYGNKQFYFTLDKGNDLEKYFYEKIKEDGSINLSGTIYTQLEFGFTISIENTFDSSEGRKTFEAGDIIAYIAPDGYCYFYFLYQQTVFTAYQKVGEI